LIADLAMVWRWGPLDGWQLTGTELRWWAEQSRRIAAERRAAADDE
jgi:hypothetical protein